MSLLIPLRIQPEASAAALPQTGVRLALPFTIGGGGGAVRTAASERKTAVFRAIAAAASLADPDDALKIADAEKETPGTSIRFISEAKNQEALEPVLEAVVEAQEDPSSGLSPTPAQKAVARAIRADAMLVAAAAAAFKEIENNDKARASGLNFVAAFDTDLLERAGQAAARETLLSLIPSESEGLPLATKVAQIQQSVTDLEGRVKVVEQRLPKRT